MDVFQRSIITKNILDKAGKGGFFEAFVVHPAEETCAVGIYILAGPFGDSLGRGDRRGVVGESARRTGKPIFLRDHCLLFLY